MKRKSFIKLMVLNCRFNNHPIFCITTTIAFNNILGESISFPATVETASKFRSSREAWRHTADDVPVNSGLTIPLYEEEYDELSNCLREQLESYDGGVSTVSIYRWVQKERMLSPRCVHLGMPSNTMADWMDGVEELPWYPGIPSVLAGCPYCWI